MVPVREKATFDPQPWNGTENKLPGVCENGGYFLKAGQGGKFVLGGIVTRPMATTKETNGKFSIYELEVGSFYAGRGLKNSLEFKDVHHAIHTVEGVVKLVIDGKEIKTTVGETTFVPAGTKWSYEAESAYSRAYIFANGGGFGEVLSTLGSEYKSAALPEVGEITTLDDSKLKALASELKFTVI
jgi:glyoxylate utilization-related uncharacterized protein